LVLSRVFISLIVGNNSFILRSSGIIRFEYVFKLSDWFFRMIQPAVCFRENTKHVQEETRTMTDVIALIAKNLSRSLGEDGKERESLRIRE